MGKLRSQTGKQEEEGTNGDGTKRVTKKSLRLLFQAHKTSMKRSTRKSYVYPRTVEAAKDPFECASGKNKMFYVIACNLFPDSKIIQPSDSECEDEEGSEYNPITPDCLLSKSPVTPTLRKPIRRRRCVRRLKYGTAAEIDLAWRTQSRRRCPQRRRRVVVGSSSGSTNASPSSSLRSKINSQNILDAINSVVKNYSEDFQQNNRSSEGNEKKSVVEEIDLVGDDKY